MLDLIIIGAGPAGLTAAIFAARYRLKTLVLGKEIGGTVLEAHVVGNYPGFKEISGVELMKKFEEHTKSLNVEIKNDEVIDIKKSENNFVIKTCKGESLKSKKILLALGTTKRKLNVKGEEKFLGKGVSYCYTCDAPLFKGKITAVIGGSDSAVKAAMLLSKYSKKVYLIYRKDKLRGEPLNVQNVEKNKKIEIIYNTNVVEIKGNKFLEKIILDTKKELKVDGLFIEIGSIPAIDLAKKLKVRLDGNFIATDKNQETSIKGIYAAGDITSNVLKQIITAAAEGAVAALGAFKTIQEENKG